MVVAASFEAKSRVVCKGRQTDGVSVPKSLLGKAAVALLQKGERYMAPAPKVENAIVKKKRE
jgi:hypothetical protein